MARATMDAVLEVSLELDQVGADHPRRRPGPKFLLATYRVERRPTAGKLTGRFSLFRARLSPDRECLLVLLLEVARGVHLVELSHAQREVVTD